MKNRRAFLTALTAVSGAAVALPMAAKARAKEPSAAALATAATFRAFDPALSEADLLAIARNIDQGRSAGAKLNPPARPLRNSDEMVARFSAVESVVPRR